MPNLIVSSDLDALLAKQTLADAKTYLGITANATDIATNDWDISRNATNIATNATDIATNATDIATNATAISTETTRATSAEGQLNTAIAAEISRAQTAEQGNATNIATNVTDIATNAGNIASNATAISTNATAISTETTRALAAEALLAPIDDATFTGTTTIPSADITTADFNTGGLGGEVSWNDQEKTLNLVTGADNVTIQLGQELTLYARNESGATLSDGQVVAISGSQGNKPTIVLAQADTVANARKTIGVVTQVIPNNSNGFVTLNGKVRNLVLDGGTFTEGEVVYLSSTVAGGITNIQPDISVELGHVLATSTGGNTNGVLEVQINNESAVHELEQQVPHNTDSVVICNDGDNIQDKYDEAVLLTGNTKTLIVMAGTYGNVELTDANILAGVNIIGIGNPTLGSIIDNATFLSTNAIYKNFTCNSFFLNIAEGNIENITTTSYFNVYRVLSLATIKDIKTGTYFQNYENNGGTIKDITCGTSFKSDLGGNYGTIKNVSAATVIVEDNYGTVDNVIATNGWVHLGNNGTIKNCSGDPFLEDLYNDGIIDNCHSTGTARAFGGNLGSHNSGTIKNCTAAGEFSFGQQRENGVTENCVGVKKAFAASSSQIVFDANGFGVRGTYRNCTAGDKSFFGANETGAIKIVDANFYNCTAGANSFGFVNFPSTETQFSGKAIGCTSGNNGFFNSAISGSTKILDGAVIENCVGGFNSFAKSISSDNEGVILRCRTGTPGPDAFSVTGTGKVRLCLDKDYNEVNLG